VPDLVKNACRVGTSFFIARYLISVARNDGFEKAERHEDLCNFYVALHRGCDPDDARMTDGGRKMYARIHDHTAQLTSYLDEQIGFESDGRFIDTRKYTPLFFKKFHALAMEAAASTSDSEGEKSE